MKMANDNDPPEEYRAVCKCGASHFQIIMREGLNYVLCAECGHDHTMTTIWAQPKEGVRE